MGIGVYFRHASSLEHDPREYLPAHPDTPERIVAIEREMASLDWLGFDVVDAAAGRPTPRSSASTARLSSKQSASWPCPAGVRSTRTRSSARRHSAPRCTRPAALVRWSSGCWMEMRDSASAVFDRLDTMPSATGRWGSACSTTSRSPPSQPSSTTGWSACSFSTGTSITAMERQRSFDTGRTCCSQASTRGGYILAPGG